MSRNILETISWNLTVLWLEWDNTAHIPKSD
jgi:hypothetical protein